MDTYTISTVEGHYKEVRQKLWDMDDVIVLDELPRGSLQIEINENTSEEIVEELDGVSAVSPDGPLEFNE